LREIYEQPAALDRTLAFYLEGNNLRSDMAKRLKDWTNPAGEVLIAASGSSRNSSLIGEVLLEDQCGLAEDLDYASELSCWGGRDRRLPAVIVISESGETSGMLATLNEARRRASKTLAITNSADYSTMARKADVSRTLITFVPPPLV
jgi:glucosamine--fructose-6-phosphate aminotransferase (isomerizing)